MQCRYVGFFTCKAILLVPWIICPGRYRLCSSTEEWNQLQSISMNCLPLPCCQGSSAAVWWEHKKTCTWQVCRQLIWRPRVNSIMFPAARAGAGIQGRYLPLTPVLKYLKSESFKPKSHCVSLCLNIITYLRFNMPTLCPLSPLTSRPIHLLTLSSFCIRSFMTSSSLICCNQEMKY